MQGHYEPDVSNRCQEPGTTILAALHSTGDGQSSQEVDCFWNLSTSLEATENVEKRVDSQLEPPEEVTDTVSGHSVVNRNRNG